MKPDKCSGWRDHKSVVEVLELHILGGKLKTPPSISKGLENPADSSGVIHWNTIRDGSLKIKRDNEEASPRCNHVAGKIKQ